MVRSAAQTTAALRDGRLGLAIDAASVVLPFDEMSLATIP